MLYASIKEKAGHYNLSEMSIVMGLAAVFFLLAAAGLGSVLHRSFDVTNKTAVIVGMVFWSGCVIWLWVAFVRMGRESPTSRNSTGELTVLQLTVTAFFGVSALFSEPTGGSEREILTDFLGALILAFHVICFTLGWGIGARIPVRTYALFAVMVGAMALPNF